MSDLDQAVLENPQAEQEAAQQLRRERVQSQKRQQTKTFKKNLPGALRALPDSVAEIARQEAEKAINEAYKFAWQRAHEFVEALAFQFFFLGALLAGPAVAALLLVRFFVGNLFQGGFTIRFQGINVRAVPAMTTTEMVYRGGKDAFIILLSVIEWAIIIVIITAVLDPSYALQLGLQALNPSSSSSTSSVAAPVQ